MRMLAEVIFFYLKLWPGYTSISNNILTYILAYITVVAGIEVGFVERRQTETQLFKDLAQAMYCASPNPANRGCCC